MSAGTADENRDEIMSFKVLNDEGVEVECEVLFTFENQETNKNYIIYTDNTLDDDGSTKVYASIYDPDAPETELTPIETDEEWAVIEIIMDVLQECASEYDEIPDSDVINEKIYERLAELNED